MAKDIIFTSCLYDYSKAQKMQGQACLLAPAPWDQLREGKVCNGLKDFAKACVLQTWPLRPLLLGVSVGKHQFPRCGKEDFRLCSVFSFMPIQHYVCSMVALNPCCRK